ncbi:MAG: signal peptidase II [Burkholderiales bacterium]
MGLNASTAKQIASWLGLAALVAGLDQATKYALGASLRPGEIREITGFFNLVFVYNRGAAFSFLSDAAGWQRELFIGIAIVAAAVIVALLARHPGERLFCAGLALILGGALGNLCDRVVLGHVVDFLDFHVLGWHWPAFNLADSAISVGAVLLILDGLRPRAQPPR